jgi:hypothetical protein
MTSVILFAGCDDEIETSSVQLDMSNEATVTAYVYAELDNTSLGLEYAPNGTKIIVSVDYSEFNPSASSGNWADTLTVNNGLVEATVPVSSNGVAVDFTPAEFVYDQVQSPGSASETIKKIYSVGGWSTLANVKPGQERIHEIIYGATSFANQTQTVSVKLQGRAVFDAETNVTEDIPSDVVITVYTDSWASEFTTERNGVFEPALPYNQWVTFEFEALKRVYNFETATYEMKNHKYTATGTYSASSPVTQILTFQSQLWE